MDHWLIIAIPLTLLLVVLLAGFVGCDAGDWFGGPAFVAAGQTYDQTVMGLSGLVAYWTLADATGTVAADTQGKDATHPNGAHPGTYTNLQAPVPYNAGQKSAAVPGPPASYFALGAKLLTSNGGGTSVEFDGGFVEIPFDAALNPPTFTIAVGVSAEWTADPAHPAFRVVIESGESEGLTEGFSLRSNTPDQWEMGVGDGTGIVVLQGSPVTLLQPPIVNFLVATYDGTNLKLFVDGKVFGPIAVAYHPSTASDLRIGSGSAKKVGANPPHALFPFNGRIGSVALFNRALDSNDLGSLGSAFLSSP